METIELSEQEASAQARSLTDTLAAQTGRPWSECWNRVRAGHPELFGLVVNREPGLTTGQKLHQQVLARADEIESGRIVNRGPAAPGEIEDLVRDFQRRNNLPSFSAAWSAAKAQHPDWFFEVA
jgi:hypothetical protein